MKKKAQKLIRLLKEKNMTVSTAESLTGGLVAASLVDIAGASNVFNEGYITYSNEAKERILGVSGNDLADYGAVSESVATAMCKGCMRVSGSDIGISTTGIAGPDGGSKEKPVGTVYIGVTTKDKTDVRKYVFSGDRDEVRNQTVETALLMAISIIDN